MQCNIKCCYLYVECRVIPLVFFLLDNIHYAFRHVTVIIIADILEDSRSTTSYKLRQHYNKQQKVILSISLRTIFKKREEAEKDFL